MNKLFTRIVVMLVLLLTGTLLFATGTTESSGPSMSADPLAGVDPTGATVVYWYQHSGSRGEALEAMIDRFNTTNQWHITVKGEYQGGYSDIYNKMITALAGGEVPNLVVAYQNQAAGYQVADGLVDMNPYVNSPEYGIQDPSDFFEGFYNQDVNAQFNNERLGFPPNRSAEVLYYNKTWLQELGFSGPPVTWDDFAKMAKAATSGADRYGYAIRTDASNVFAMVISRGGTITKPNGAGYLLNTPENKASMQFMKSLYDSGAAKKIGESYGDQTDFGNHKVLFTMGSTSGLPFYQQAVDAGEGGTFEWSVAAIPHTTPKAQIDVYGASVSIPKTTPEQELAAWLFVRWMSEPEQQAEWTRISNYFPVRKSVAAELGDYFKENPTFETAFNILTTSDTQAEPPYAGYDEVRDLMSGAFNAILDGANIDTTLAKLEADANEAHKMASP